MNPEAALSSCGHYRWWLKRAWQPELPPLVFIGLNPSRADGQRDDPTLRRIVGFARVWGYGSVTVLNLFARISPSPAVLRRCDDPVGTENNQWLQHAFDGTALWLGWGNHGRWMERDRQLMALLQVAVPPAALMALGLTALGQPRHPLYVPAGAKPLTLALAQTTGADASCGQRADASWPAHRADTPFICT